MFVFQYIVVSDNCDGLKNRLRPVYSGHVSRLNPRLTALSSMLCTNTIICACFTLTLCL